MREQLFAKAVRGEELPGSPRVLAGDQIDLAQHLQGAGAYIARITDRGRDHEQDSGRICGAAQNRAGVGSFVRGPIATLQSAPEPEKERARVPESKRGILLISCIDRPGIIAGVAGQLFDLGCNIITSDQHTDDADGHFFWRIDFESSQRPLPEVAQSLTDSLPGLLPWEQLRWHLYDAARRDRMVIMVSRLAHCMMDLLSRYRFGELEAE